LFQRRASEHRYEDYASIFTLGTSDGLNEDLTGDSLKDSSARASPIDRDGLRTSEVVILHDEASDGSNLRHRRRELQDVEPSEPASVNVDLPVCNVRSISKHEEVESHVSSSSTSSTSA
jgi:hypothetical protein